MTWCTSPTRIVSCVYCGVLRLGVSDLAWPPLSGFVQDLLVKVHGNKSPAEYIKNRAEAAGEGLGNGHYWDDNQGAEAPRVLLCWTCHVYSVGIVS